MLFFLNWVIPINKDNSYLLLELFFFILQVAFVTEMYDSIPEWKPCKLDTWACVYYDHNLLVLPSKKIIHNMKNTKCHTLTTVTKHNRKII